MKTYIKSMRLVLLVLFVGMTVLISSSAGRSSQGLKPAIKQAMLNLPLYFEENRGQADSKARFISRGNGYGMFLTQTEAVLVLKQQESSVIRMQFAGANPEAEMTGFDQLSGKSNYFIGNDSSKWRSDIAQYSKVKWTGIYSGIDLVFYGNQRLLEFDYVVAPGVDPKTIRLKVDGADTLEVDDEGNLEIRVGANSVLLKKPVCYQKRDNTKKSVACCFSRLDGKQVGFNVGSYDTGLPLVIDPILEYSTYLGGSQEDFSIVKVDSSGNAYVVGGTISADFPLVNPIHATLRGSADIVISKINVAGNALVYSTYFGGSNTSYDESARGHAIDSDGNLYVCGVTSSDDFPLLNPMQSSRAGGRDSFVTKINTMGNGVIYSTYIGGSEDDDTDGIAVDSLGNAYVVGYTRSADFPIMNPIQATIADVNSPDGFIAKVNAVGDGLVYSTYFGGMDSDYIQDIAVDSMFNAYVAGFTFSSDLQTVNPIQATYSMGTGDAFVMKIDPPGNNIVYSTYLGGGGYDDARGIAADATGNAYICGSTDSDDFPTLNAIQAIRGGNSDAFITKISPTGDGILYSTYYGGSGVDQSFGIAIDNTGNVFISGTTMSNDLPLVEPYQVALAGPRDAFLTKIDQTGSDVLFSTYMGGGGSDIQEFECAGSVSVDSSGNAYIAGGTRFSDFPNVNALQPLYGGNGDGFVAKFIGFDFTPTPTPTPTATPTWTNTRTITPTVTPTVTSTPQIPWCDELFVSVNLFNVPKDKTILARVLLCSPEEFSINIYNGVGEMVRILKPWAFTSDTYIEAQWDGKNMKGEPVASGVYIVRFEGSRGADTRKLVVLR